jgi:hypothetical protein
MHVFDALSFIPYGTIVDNFQHIVYSNPDMTPAERNDTWNRLEEQFRPYLSAEGMTYLSKGTRWQYQMHIYEVPFYYIDYCLAQMVAFQFLLASRRDYADAFRRYVRHVSYGGELLFNDLLKEAGLKSPFEDGALKDVAKEIERQAGYLSRKEILKRSLADFSAIIIVNNIDEAVELVNKVAPEHLELCVDEPFSRLGDIKNAGAIFLGHYSSEPLGDYFAGPNHVLPTGGTARFFSPLNTADFVKKSSVVSYTKKALLKAKDDIMLFAKSEGLDGHANAIGVRFEDKGV